MSWSNEQTTILIEEYAKYPCLYVIKHKEYHNKQLRNQALQKIVEKIRPIRPMVNEGDVLKKFLGLRTTYSNERRKVLSSLRSGIGEDDVYKPALWYYDKLSYLNDQLNIRNSKTSFEPPHLVSEDECDLQVAEESQLALAESEQLTIDIPEHFTEVEYNVLEDGSLISPPIENLKRDSSSSSSTMSPVAWSSKRKRKSEESVKSGMKKIDQDMILLDEVTKNLGRVARTVQPSSKSEEDVFGELVAMQLKKIDDEELRRDVQYEIHGVLHNAFKKCKK